MHTEKPSLIVAINEKRVIGGNGRLLWRLPSDLRHFRELTIGSVVVMGRKTFESIGKPLPKRVNVILTRQSGLEVEGCEVVSTLEDALAVGARESKAVFVIGGGEIYRLALPSTEYIYLTVVHDDGVEGDATFPKLDSREWKLVVHKEGTRQPEDKFPFDFFEYKRRR
ncbi:MAG: dihydrofolate reductase [Candidatus Pacebacteria bacterium]|nr:dihydrofolate reductase [Candidatus Paceibacterota bacterium]